MLKVRLDALNRCFL